MEGPADAEEKTSEFIRSHQAASCPVRRKHLQAIDGAVHQRGHKFPTHRRVCPRLIPSCDAGLATALLALNHRLRKHLIIGRLGVLEIMSVFRRLMGVLPPEHHAELTTALIRGRPNSEDPSAPNVPRRLASERRAATRNMDELIGMCRMVLADGAVDDHEARFLLDWIEKNYLASQEWPGNVLYPRLAAAMADGHLDQQEEAELLDVLAKVAGGPPATTGPAVSGAIPYDTPPPGIAFASQCFALTGQFVYGPRTKITAVIENRGGHVANSVSKKCQFLVVGTFGSDEWLHSTHGTKIIKAAQLKRDGAPIFIVTERHWTDQLSAPPEK